MSAYRSTRVSRSKQIHKIKEHLQQMRIENLVERKPLSQSLSEMVMFCEENFSRDPMLNPHKERRHAPQGISAACAIL